MLHKESRGVKWLEFELFADIPKLTHGVFLRHGGHSSGPYASLNLSETVGDCPENVRRNLDEVKDRLKLLNLIWAHQVHGKAIVAIDSKAQTEILQADALSTCCPGIGLMVNHADCQAAIFYDPIHHAIANVHAGWRGSVQNIYAETIHFMQHKYKSKPEDLLVGISPSLGPQDAQFVNYRQELPEPFWEFQTTPAYFDFWAISKMQLMECGVLAHHIEIAGISTYSHPEDYFSFRRKDSGRNGTLVALI